MRENFEPALALVLGFEGGILKDEDDAKRAGGITNMGITQNTWNEAVRLGIVPDIPLTEATFGHVKAIYLNRYWMRCKCDHLPGPIDALVCDMAINCGCHTARKRLQMACNVYGVNLVVDGLIGPVTIGAVSRLANRSVRSLAGSYLLERVDRYNELLSGNPNTDPDYKWIRGWLLRIEKLRKYAKV